MSSFQKDFLSKKITDPLAKIVSDLSKQEYAQNFQVQNIDTLNVQVLSIKTKTKTLSKDKFHVSVKSYDSEQRFYNAVYPDRKKMKLWIKGENSDKLHDYALMNHTAHLWSGYQVAEQYQRDEPNNMAGYEDVSYANGTHYIHVQDRDDLRISDLIVDEPSNEGFTIILRYYPLIQADSKQEPIILEQKIDSSQNRYGHSVNVDQNGNIYFYVRYNYRQYYVMIKKPILIPSYFSNFAVENYMPENYWTESGQLADVTTMSYDLVCQFNYSTKECSIKVYHNGILEHTASSTTGDTALPSGLQLRLPFQEGKWSEVQALPSNTPLNQVFDSSVNQKIGTVTGLDTGGLWNDNNTLTSLGSNVAGTSDGVAIDFPTITPLDTLTEFTVCFWYNPLNEIVNNKTYNTRLITKGYAVASSFYIERRFGVNDLKFSIRDASNVETSVTRTTPFPVANQWYFVVCKWKSGEGLKISINDDANTVSSNLTTTLSSAANLIKIFNASKAPIGIPLNVLVFSKQLTPTEQTLVYDFGEHIAAFPKNLEPQRLMNPSPPPVTNPITTIYDLSKLSSPILTDYTFINNPSSQNPFVDKYNCSDGTAGGVPVVTIYNIAAGTGGTSQNPFSTLYQLTPANSTGDIDNAADEWAYGQYITNAASDLFGQKVSEIQLYLKTDSSNEAEGGSVYLGVIKSNADPAVPTSYIKFGTGIAVSALLTDWTSYTKQLLNNTYVMALNDAVGIIWEGGTGGVIQIQRGGSTHYEAESRQNAADDGGWGTPNSSFSMAGTIKKGGDTVGTSPYYSLKNATNFNYVVGEYFPTGSPMIGEKPTRAEFRVYRDSAATNGTVSIRHVKSDGTYWATLYEVNVSTLPNETAIPTTFNFVWENLDYSRAIIAGDRIAVVTNGLTTGNVYVLSNVGNSASGNSYDTTRSYLNYRNFNGTWGSATAYDVSGVIKKGGNSFTAVMRFSATVTRIYERAINASSIFYDQPLSKVIVRGKRVGTIPTPALLTARLRSSANVEKYVIGTLDANSISTTLGDITFTNNNNVIKVATGDYVSIEIDTCDASNYIELNITNVPYDSGNSLMGSMDTGVIADIASYDLAGKFSIGGQIDNVSRKRIAQYIDTQDSIFLTVPNNRVTIFEAQLIAVGAPTGLVYINIRRGFDDALIFNLGSVSASSIATALAGTTIHIENFNNTYVLSAKDKVSIEYEGGDQTNKIGVQIRTVIPDYDGVNSYIARYNGVVYDFLTNKDMVAKMRVGGDTYTPEANAPPPVLPQTPTDLYVLSGIDKRQNSFMRCMFGMYLFFNTLLTDQELNQFNYTRIDTGNNAPNEIQCTNHSFFRNA